MAEMTIELAVHKNVDPDEGVCGGNLAQTLRGGAKCNECDKSLNNETLINPDLQSAQTLGWGLVVITDTVLKEVFDRN